MINRLKNGLNSGFARGVPKRYIGNRYLRARWARPAASPSLLTMVVLYHKIAQKSSIIFQNHAQICNTRAPLFRHFAGHFCDTSRARRHSVVPQRRAPRAPCLGHSVLAWEWGNVGRLNWGMGMGDEATTPFLSRIGGEIFHNYGGIFPVVQK